MTVQNVPTPSAPGDEPSAIALVDTDTHPLFAADWATELSPYLTAEWREQFRVDEGSLKSKVPNYWPAVRYQLPTNGMYPRRGSPVRMELIGDNGEMPGSDSRVASAEHLDKYNIDRAIMIPQSVFGIGAFPNGAVAAAIASATNRWMAERWYEEDHRWRGALAIAPQDPESAVKEILYWKDSPAFAGIFISHGATLLGRKEFHPIYEVAEEYGFALTLHPTGAEGIYASGPSFAGGMPEYHLDYRFMEMQPYQATLANLIAAGVFERFPRLRYVFTEVGFAWLVDLMWKMDGYWKTAREETPWVKRAPSEYIKSNVRFSSQPFIEPDKPEHVASLLDMIHAETTLMFATDYPHWDGDEPKHLNVKPSLREAVLAGNALDAYPRLRM